MGHAGAGGDGQRPRVRHDGLPRRAQRLLALQQQAQLQQLLMEQQAAVQQQQHAAAELAALLNAGVQVQLL